MSALHPSRAAPSPRLAPIAATAAAAALALLSASPPAWATVEEPYTPGEAPATTTWFAPASATAQRADRDYVAGMRPHHAGALTMSRDYLEDPARSSPLLQVLARVIVVNQGFEIGVLDEVARNLDAPPLRLPFGVVLQPVATEGLTGRQRFFKAPIPSPASAPMGPVGERDVQFAKAMITHHQGAVEMARAYHANPEARNGFLGLMNVDIVTDQTQEIALMRAVIAAYPGDADRVRVDPSMIHGMEGMAHGGEAPHGGHGGSHADHAAPADHARHGALAADQAAAPTPAGPKAQPRPAPRARPAARGTAAPGGAAHAPDRHHDHHHGAQHHHHGHDGHQGGQHRH